MNNSIKRMMALAEKLGLDIRAKTKSLAELKGYEAGLKCIWQDYFYIAEQYSPNTAKGLALDFMCNMFNIDSECSEDKKREQICNGFKKRFGDYGCNEFSDILAGYGLMIVSSPCEYTISGRSMKNTGAMDIIGSLLKNYAVPGVYITFSGEGYTFDYWDSKLYCFDDYDNLGLSFNMLDTMM